MSIRMRNLLSLVLAVLLMGAGGFAQAQSFCPPLDGRQAGRDYLDPSVRQAAVGVERRHFTESVRTLQRGETSRLISDIEYMLNMFPNHHGALDALTRLALRENAATPRGAALSTECRFMRAAQISPRDGMVPLIHGIYLVKRGQTENARKELEKAATLSPNDANVQYNLGLVLLQLKEYQAARRHAKVAYDLGFPLPGLRNLLARAGYPLGD